MTRRARHLTGDDGTTLTELVVSVIVGGIVLASAAMIFLPAVQNAARDRQAGLNLAVANSASSVLQRQVRDATYVQPSKGSTSAESNLVLCTYPRATSTAREIVTWKYVTSTGLTMTIGSRSTAERYGDRYTFDKGLFDDTLKYDKGRQDVVLNMRLVTGDIADGRVAGTAGTTLQFSAAPRSPQVSAPSSCA